MIEMTMCTEHHFRRTSAQLKLLLHCVKIEAWVDNNARSRSIALAEIAIGRERATVHSGDFESHNQYAAQLPLVHPTQIDGLGGDI